MNMPKTEKEWLEVADQFENRWNFPHVLGLYATIFFKPIINFIIDHSFD
jgi:hypothetical protein